MENNSKNEKIAKDGSAPKTNEVIETEKTEAQNKPKVLSAVARGRGGPNDPEDK